MVDSRATNTFVHSMVIQELNAIAVDIPAMRVTLDDGSYVDCSIIFLLSFGNGTYGLSCFVSYLAKSDQWCGLRHGMVP